MAWLEILIAGVGGLFGFSGIFAILFSSSST
jgi:hypothetical protein